MSPTVFKVIPSDKSGLQLTKKGFTAKKSKLSELKSPLQGNLLLHLYCNFQFFAIVLSYIVQRAFWGGSITFLEINLVSN